MLDTRDTWILRFRWSGVLEMVMKSYSPEFKADAVALYLARPEATLDTVAADLGVSRETLRGWVAAAGVSKPRGRRPEVVGAGSAGDPADEVAVLRRRVKELEEER